MQMDLVVVLTNQVKSLSIQLIVDCAARSVAYPNIKKVFTNAIRNLRSKGHSIPPPRPERQSSRAVKYEPR